MGLKKSLAVATFVFATRCCLILASNPTNVTSTLLSSLLDTYDTRVYPQADKNSSLRVALSFTLSMLVTFDDLTGQLDFLGEFVMNWTDERLIWDPTKYGGKTDIIVPKTSIWIPELTVPTLLNRDSTPGSSATKVRVSSDGIAVLISDSLLSVTCSLDVKDYPNDQQSCDVMIYADGYISNELTLYHREHTPKVSIENSEWKVQSFSKTTDQSTFVIYFDLERRKGYIQITLQAPILTLGILNPWVFLLPPESGERTSFSITAFLSFTVYMGILTDHIPRGSKPIPDALYEIFINLIYSAAILFCTILSLKLHMRTEEKPIPKCLQRLVRVLTCSCHRKQSTITDKCYSSTTGSPERLFIKMQNPILITENKEESKSKEQKGSVNGKTSDEVTWATVGYLFDICMLIMFYSIFLSVTMYYNYFT